MRAAYLLALMAIGASTSALAYQGDGLLIDHGVLAAHNRYVLDLGLVDLSRPSRREYSLGKLPSEEFTVGLRLAQPKPERGTYTARIRLTLLNEKGDVIFDVARALEQWTWSEASDQVFVYGKGPEKEVRAPAGSIRFERVGINADGGWGTYFRARRNGRYRLIFETITPDNRLADANITLRALGGGWK